MEDYEAPVVTVSVSSRAYIARTPDSFNRTTKVGDKIRMAFVKFPSSISFGERVVERDGDGLEAKLPYDFEDLDEIIVFQYNLFSEQTSIHFSEGNPVPRVS